MGSALRTTRPAGRVDSIDGPIGSGRRGRDEARGEHGTGDPLLIEAGEAGNAADSEDAMNNGLSDGRRGAPRDPLGRVVLALVQATVPTRLEELQNPRVAPLVQRLRRRVGLALAATVATLPIAFWQLMDGALTYIKTEKPTCGGPMRIWLLGFLMLQLVWPTCMPSATMLLLGWCLGALFLLRDPPGCPKLHEFVVQALLLQCLQTLLLFLATYAALAAQPLLQRLKEILSERGTPAEIISLITILPATEVMPEEECVICLNCEEEEGVPWRELKCAHRFHETCLLQWLAKARRCPICRSDLQDMYASEMEAAEADVAGPTPVPTEDPEAPEASEAE